MPSHALVAVYDPNHASPRALDIQSDLGQMLDAVHASGRMRLELVLNADIESIRKRLMQSKPRFRLFHFSGHSNTSGIVIRAEQGGATQPPLSALSDLLRSNAKGLQCVMLNSCDGLAQAALIAQWAPYVIAMAGPIQDQSAIDFARVFYTYYRGPSSIENAFKQAVNKLHLNATGDWLLPRLFVRGEDVTAYYDERATPPDAPASRPVELPRHASGMTPLLRHLSGSLMAGGSPFGRTIAARIREHDLLDDLTASRADPSGYHVQCQQGSLRMLDGTRYFSIACRPGGDVKLFYHAPSRAPLHGSAVSLFYDGHTGTLYVRFGGRNVFTLGSIAA